MPAADTARTSTISVQQAHDLVQRHAIRSASERRPLREACGSVLREEVRADRDFPPFDRVMMDGIAISYAAFSGGRRSFPIEGIQAAGAQRKSLTDGQHCLEVMTGAVLPGGCDCVIPVEHIRREDETALIDSSVEVAQLQHIHRQGSDHRAGDLLLVPGSILRAPDIAICATVGKPAVSVSHRLSVAVVSTGDELVGIDKTPEPHQIRVSNSFAIEAELARSDCAQAELFHASDNEKELGSLLSDLLSRFDLLVVSGGVSAGRFDLVPQALEALGVEKVFHRVFQRPGFPLYFGIAPAGKAVFALPGNPVSSLVSTRRYIVPYLRTSSGAAASPPEYAVLDERVEFHRPLTLFLPVTTKMTGGTLLAHPVPTNGSGDLAALAGTDGFLELPADESTFDDGTAWQLYRWE